MKKIAGILAILMFSVLPLPTQTAPLPPRLTSARAAFVVNDGVWTKAFDKFFKELHKWGRFEFVATRNEADIVIVLSNRIHDTGATYTSTTRSGAGSQTVSGGVYSSTTTARSNTGSTTIQVPIKSNIFYLRILDSEDDSILWSDSKGASFLLSNSAKGLVSNLKKRFKGVGYTNRPEKPKAEVAPESTQEAARLNDGNNLLKVCIQAVRGMDGETLDDLQHMDSMYCMGYVVGFMDFHGIVVGLKRNPIICLPDGIQNGQFARIIVKWLKEHPEKLHLNSGVITFAALTEAFPCQKEDSSA